jgi:hypothetical protein
MQSDRAMITCLAVPSGNLPSGTIWSVPGFASSEAQIDGLAVRQRRLIVDHRARFSTLSAGYDDFLFSAVCVEANGMRLSVLSALARMNVDPWEEAGRLAALPKAVAEKRLLSAFDLVSGRSWKSPEAAAIAASLVRLLPPPGQAAITTGPLSTSAAAGAAKGHAERRRYWWVWLAFWVAMSFMVHNHHADSTNAGIVSSTAGPVAPLNNGSSSPNSGAQSR